MRLNSASAQSSDAFAFITSGTCMRIERLVGGEPEPRFDLRGVRLGLRSCASASVRGNADEHRAVRHARAALDRRRDHAAGRFRRDLRLFVGDQRSGHAQVAIDRLVLRPSPHARRQRRALAVRRRWSCRRCTPGSTRRGDSRRAEHERSLTYES